MVELINGGEFSMSTRFCEKTTPEALSVPRRAGLAWGGGGCRITSLLPYWPIGTLFDHGLRR